MMPTTYAPAIAPWPELPTVIALIGPAGSGKSTVATRLVENYGAVRYSFAAPLKEVAKRALEFSDAQLYGTQEEKEAIDPRYGFSARWFLQRLGTEGCRGVFGLDFLTKMCLDIIRRQNPRLAVIEDMRFGDEAEAVLYSMRLNGHVWRLHPPSDVEAVTRADSAGAHSSELEWQTSQASLELAPTARGVEELRALADAAMTLIPLRGVDA